MLLLNIKTRMFDLVAEDILPIYLLWWTKVLS